MVFPIALNPRISAFTTTVTVMLPAVSSNCFCPHPTVSPLSRQRSPSCRVTSCVFKSDFYASGSDSLQLTEFLKDVDVLSLLKEAAQAEPPPLFWGDSERMETIYLNYRDAIYQSGDPSADEIVMFNTARVFDLMHLKDPLEFSSYHEAIRAPFDYYEFGQKYFRPLIDFKNSYVGNISIFQEIQEKLHKGENVILMSNHQADVDPVFIALLLESTHPLICENMAQFDSWVVVMMRELVERWGIPSHVYPLALLSTDDRMSFPIQVEKDVEEKRIISFHGVGLSVGPMMNFHEATVSFDDPNEEAKTAYYTQTLYDSVNYQYKVFEVCYT